MSLPSHGSSKQESPCFNNGECQNSVTTAFSEVCTRMNVNRINPNRLSTPSDINEALDAISAELTRLKDLQERVMARKGEIVAKAAIDGIPGLVDAEDPVALIADLIKDAEAFREMEAASKAPAVKKADKADGDGEDSLF